MSKQSHRHVLVTNSVATPAVDATSTALTAGQIGIFEVPSYKAKRDFDTVKRVQIFQGTADFEVPVLAGVPNFNRRTLEFNVKNIIAARLKAPVTAVPRVVTIGYDATANALGTLPLYGGKKKEVHITLTGVPINQEMGHRDGLTRTFLIETPTDADPDVLYSASLIADDLKAQIERDPIMKKYLTVTKSTSAALAGLALTSTVVKRDRSNLYLMGHYAYEADVVHIEINTWSRDYNEAYAPDSAEWEVKEKTALVYGQGKGEYIREQEKRSLQHEFNEYSCDPVQLDNYGYTLNAIAANSYDEYEFEVKATPTNTEGFGSVEEKRIISIYLPAGTGRAATELGTVLSALAVDAGLPALF